MAFCRGREAAFPAETAMAMETGSPALWLERKEAKKQESRTRRVESQAVQLGDWRRRQVERGFRNRAR